MHPSPEPGTRVAVRSAVAPLLSEPRISASQVSQRVSGHLLEVLERSSDDWVRVRGDDGYEGWTHRGYIDALERFEPDRPGTLVSLGCTTERADGGRRRLPLLARLWPGERPVEGETIAVRQLPERFPATRAALVQSARTLFVGASYEWGGITPWGADCSGFVQSIFALHGIRLPRDAWQQASTGEDAGANPLALAPGDLHFFSDRPDGRITHVGIACENGRMAHSALGRGANVVDDLSGSGDGYVRALVERFRFGRRILEG